MRKVKIVKFIFNLLEFIFLFIAFVLPSFMAQSTTELLVNTNPPINPIFVRLLLIVYLSIRLHDAGVFHKKRHLITINKALKITFSSLKLFLVLQTTAVVCNIFLSVIPHTEITLIADRPNTIATWAWFLSTVIILATFEEILYRGYFPEKMLHSLRNCFWFRKLHKKEKNITKLLIEVTIILVFALGHSYMGIKSVIVSFACGVVLRISVKTKRNLIVASIAHIGNNLVSYALLFLVTS